jgi:hypothetical protein
LGSVGWPKSVYRFLGGLLLLGGLITAAYSGLKVLDMNAALSTPGFERFAPVVWALVVMVFVLGLGLAAFGAYMVAAGAPLPGLRDAVETYDPPLSSGLPENRLSSTAARTGAHELAPIRPGDADLLSTRDALASVIVTLDQAVPELWLLPEGALNAIAWDEPTGSCVGVTESFAQLPPSEQRVGLGMLLCRRNDDRDVGAVPGYLLATEARARQADHFHLESWESEARRCVDAWLGAVSAGDRRALLILRDPDCMLALLHRLADSVTVLPIEAPESWELEAAGYRTLAWPLLVEPPGPDPDRERISLFIEALPGPMALGETAQNQHRPPIEQAPQPDAPEVGAQ